MSRYTIKAPQFAASVHTPSYDKPLNDHAVLLPHQGPPYDEQFSLFGLPTWQASKTCLSPRYKHKSSLVPVYVIRGVSRHRSCWPPFVSPSATFLFVTPLLLPSAWFGLLVPLADTPQRLRLSIAANEAREMWPGEGCEQVWRILGVPNLAACRVEDTCPDGWTGFA